MRYLRLAACLAMLALAALFAPPCLADLDRDALQTSLQRMDRDTGRLISSITFFLQSRGRWAPVPQGNDMQLCQVLQNFQQQLSQLSRDARSGRPSPLFQSQIAQLQGMGQTIDQLLAVTGATPDITSRWMSIRSSLISLNQLLYFGSGDYFWNRVDSYNGPAIAAPPNQAVGLAVSQIDSSTNRLVNSVQSFLQRQGRWPPPGMSAEMQLCSQLQTFQKTVKQLKRASDSRQNLSAMQGQVVQLQAMGSNIERMLGMLGATADVTSQWWNVRNGLINLNQVVYAGGGGGFFGRNRLF